MIERILVVAPHLGTLTACANTLDELTARRTHVHIAVHDQPPLGTDLTVFTAKFRRLTVGSAPPPDEWAALGMAVRGWLDQARQHEPSALGVLRRLMMPIARRVERSIPSSPRIIEFLRAHQPDVLIVVPLFGIGSMAPAYVQAGAGIVADSVPSAEYQETLNKARGLLKAIELAEQGGRTA